MQKIEIHIEITVFLYSSFFKSLLILVVGQDKCFICQIMILATGWKIITKIEGCALLHEMKFLCESGVAFLFDKKSVISFLRKADIVEVMYIISFERFCFKKKKFTIL